MDLSPRPSGQSVMSDSYASTLSTKFFPMSTKSRKPQPASSEEQAAVISRATTQAIAAARSIILSGGTSASALSTAEAAAQSVLSPKPGNHHPGSGSGTSHHLKPPRTGYLERRKCKQQAQVIANMALVSVRSNIQQSHSLIGNYKEFSYTTEDPTALFMSNPTTHKHHTVTTTTTTSPAGNKVESVYFEKAPKVVSPMLSEDMDSSGLCCGSPPAATHKKSRWLSPRSHRGHQQEHQQAQQQQATTPGTPSTTKSADSPQTERSQSQQPQTTATGEYFRKKQERADNAENQTSPKIRVDIVASHSIGSRCSSSSDEDEDSSDDDEASDASSNDDDDDTAEEEDEDDDDVSEQGYEEDSMSYDHTEGESNATDGVFESLTLDTDFTEDNVEGAAAGDLQPYPATTTTLATPSTQQKKTLSIVPHNDDDDDDMASSMFMDPLKALSHAITCTPLHTTSPRFDYRDDALGRDFGLTSPRERYNSDEGSVDRFFKELKGAATSPVSRALDSSEGAATSDKLNKPEEQQQTGATECTIERRVLNALASAISPKNKKSSPLEVDTKLSSSPNRSISPSKWLRSSPQRVLSRETASTSSPSRGSNGNERPFVDKAALASHDTHSSPMTHHQHRYGGAHNELEQQPAAEINTGTAKKKSWLQRKTRIRALKRFEL